jgi:hypothetical protein
MKKRLFFLISSVIVFSLSYSQKPAIIIDATYDLLIGGVKNGELVGSDDIVSSVKGGESYKLYSLNGFIKCVNGYESESMGPPCDAAQSVSTPFDKPKNGSIVTGISCDWDPFPKTLKITSTDQKTYKDIVANILKEKGINNPVVELTAVIRTDLENDGVEEVLISATHYTNGLTPSGNAGDYSMIVLRKIINGKIENMVIESNVYTQNINSVIPYLFQIANILDLDNDGKMEIIVFSEYYEGYLFIIYKMMNNKAVEVLAVGCGA